MLVRQWDDEPLSVVYDPVRGDTHLLDALLVEILRLLSEQPQSGADLYAGLADVIDGGNFAEALSSINDSLARLEEMGLVKKNFP